MKVVEKIFSLQLSSQTRFDKINKKKVIAENQYEKHKKSSFFFFFFFLDQCRSWMLTTNVAEIV